MKAKIYVWRTVLHKHEIEVEVPEDVDIMQAIKEAEKNREYWKISSEFNKRGIKVLRTNDAVPEPNDINIIGFDIQEK